MIFKNEIREAYGFPPLLKDEWLKSQCWRKYLLSLSRYKAKQYLKTLSLIQKNL